MPILPPEASVFPVGLFELAAQSYERDRRWWVLRTRPRAEKALARQLLGRNVHYFLPLFQKRSRINGRSISSFHPLFAGYMFLHGDADDRLYALQTNLVAQVLHAENQIQLQQDLARVHGLMLADAALTPEERLLPGMLVEIVAGPLMGLTGKIITRQKKMRLLVEVRFLQQGVSVDVESWMIQPLAQPQALATRV